MSRVALLCWVFAGCFYGAPINQRPSIDILQVSPGVVYRGDTIALQAVAEDPENHPVHFEWRAYACTTAEPTPEPDGLPAGCDHEPFHTEAKLADTELVVPFSRVDEDVPVQAILVKLTAEDDFGATARPIQQLVIPISNHAPVLELAMRTHYGYAESYPIELYAKVSDADDGAASVLPLAWTVYTPLNQPAYLLDELDVPDPDAPVFLQTGKTFTPMGVGEWEIEVTATDPLGAETVKSLIVNVVPDAPPCLGQWLPITAPAGEVLPLTEPTLFSVPIVEDDLDPYPAVPGNTVFGTTTFAWSILPPGATIRQDLGVTGNQVALDPASYTPGEIVELRVEIVDRKSAWPACADDALTCSVISDPQCIQRLTWRVEVR